jgi:hypothetical protein
MNRCMNRCLELCLEYLTCLDFFSSIAKHVRIAFNACCYFFNIRSVMVSKYREEAGPRPLREVRFSLEPHRFSSLMLGGGKF